MPLSCSVFALICRSWCCSGWLGLAWLGCLSLLREPGPSRLLYRLIPLASSHLFMLKTSCTLIWHRFCLRDVGRVLWSYMMPRLATLVVAILSSVLIVPEVLRVHAQQSAFVGWAVHWHLVNLVLVATALAGRWIFLWPYWMSLTYTYPLATPGLLCLSELVSSGCLISTGAHVVWPLSWPLSPSTVYGSW